MEYYKRYKRRETDEDDEDIEYGVILTSNSVSHLVSSKRRKPRTPNRAQKCYRKWSGKDLRVTRATFNLILDVIVPYIFKEPTNLNPEPIIVDRKLGLTLYRLSHGVS